MKVYFYTIIRWPNTTPSMYMVRNRGKATEQVSNTVPQLTCRYIFFFYFNCRQFSWINRLRQIHFRQQILLQFSEKVAALAVLQVLTGAGLTGTRPVLKNSQGLSWTTPSPIELNSLKRQY